MAKKTKNQVYDEWVEKQSKRHRGRRKDPHYSKLIQEISSIAVQLAEAANKRQSLLSNIPKGTPISVSDQRIKNLHAVEDSIKSLSNRKTTLEKELIETFGFIDPVLENISDQELMIFSDFNFNPFNDIWVVEPILWSWKKPLIRINEDRNKINWDAYLDDRGFIRFRIKTDNPREVIKERLGSWVDILRDSKTITFKKGGKPSVNIIGSLYSLDGLGAIVELNPFAPKEKILKTVIQTLRSHGTIFTRKDSLHPERRKALKLFREGKNFKEIAFKLWPKQFEEEEKKIEKKENGVEERVLYEQYVNKLVRKGKLWNQAYKEADKKFHLKGKTPVNPLIVKAYRLIK